jgi:hypothetical protein
VSRRIKTSESSYSSNSWESVYMAVHFESYKCQVREFVKEKEKYFSRG